MALSFLFSRVFFFLLINCFRQEQCKCNAAERLNPNELDVLTSFLDAMSLDVQEFVVQGAECNPNSTRIRCFDGKVEALNFDAFPLSSVHPLIGRLTSMTNLALSNNGGLRSLPSQIGLLENLKNLYLRSNKYEQLPSEIGSLTRLKLLHLYSNELTVLPSQIGQLDLTALYAHNNRLTSIPSQVGRLTSMNALTVATNQLKDLPSELALLTSLGNFHLHSNQIEVLPSEFLQFKFLKSLRAYHNRLIGIEFPFRVTTDITNCEMQGNYSPERFETNCFIDCPSICCESNFRFPNCSSTTPTTTTLETLTLKTITTNANTTTTMTQTQTATLNLSTKANSVSTSEIDSSSSTSLQPVTSSPSFSTFPNQIMEASMLSSMEAIIGISVGSFFILICLIVVIVCVLKKKKKTSSFKQSVQNDVSEMHSFSDTYQKLDLSARATHSTADYEDASSLRKMQTKNDAYEIGNVGV